MTDTLIASLAALHTDDEDSVNVLGGYLDWSTRLDDGRRLEVGDSAGNAIMLDLDRSTLVRLHAALTLTLLADQTSAG